ncbi:hypothetical protein WA026_014650 [Henosepilachna vigintioctopunctata]|uniref:Uncharacterized protein n=1 Tax=Henosepilachna vigintioctopunctata TaxID=420089 RepID=A0AAW1V8C5_9CUCU
MLPVETDDTTDGAPTSNCDAKYRDISWKWLRNVMLHRAEMRVVTAINSSPQPVMHPHQKRQLTNCPQFRNAYLQFPPSSSITFAEYLINKIDLAHSRAE